MTSESQEQVTRADQQRSLDIAQEVMPSYRQVASDLAFGQTEEDQYARHGAMRSVGGTAYVMAGAMMASEGAGLASKIVGATLVAKGLHESITAARMLRGEAKEETSFMRMRDRVSEFGRSLIDNTSGKMNLRAKLKRRVGEKLAVVNDGEYANRFSRLTGGMAMTLAGVEFMNQPGAAPKMAAAGLMSLGVFETWRNGVKLNKKDE